LDALRASSSIALVTVSIAFWIRQMASPLNCWGATFWQARDGRAASGDKLLAQGGQLLDVSHD